ncbi:hypothetical protein D7X33_29035, partial [Butyricicoccus sp. 1XD8-22]
RRRGVQGQSPAARRAGAGCRGRAPPLAAQVQGAGAEPRRCFSHESYKNAAFSGQNLCPVGIAKSAFSLYTYK